MNPVFENLLKKKIIIFPVILEVWLFSKNVNKNVYEFLPLQWILLNCSDVCHNSKLVLQILNFQIQINSFYPTIRKTSTHFFWNGVSVFFILGLGFFCWVGFGLGVLFGFVCLVLFLFLNLPKIISSNDNTAVDPEIQILLSSIELYHYIL